MTAPALPLAELRARYDALGELEEWPGERTFISRCQSFDEFLKFGPLVAQDFATFRQRSPDEAADMVAMHPGLSALVDAAWPDAKPRPR
jgi:hypothetical protein